MDGAKGWWTGPRSAKTSSWTQLSAPSVKNPANL